MNVEIKWEDKKFCLCLHEHYIQILVKFSLYKGKYRIFFHILLYFIHYNEIFFKTGDQRNNRNKKKNNFFHFSTFYILLQIIF